MLRRIMIIISLLMIPVLHGESFALIDIGTYGGYSFGKYVEAENNVNDKMDGLQYGAFLNLGGGIGPVYLASGIFYHASKLTVERDSGDADVNKSSFGLEGLLMIKTELIHALPYLRLGFSLKDEYRTELNGDVTEKTRYLSTGIFGAGLALNVHEIFKIFFEYTFVTSTYASNSSKKYLNNGVNLGIRMVL